ncbi:MAG: KEOPS complex subunit Cgi121, partial [Candidatus Bathyarchaeia archaeon]
GLKSSIENFFQELKKVSDVEFQLLNLSLIAGKEHLYFSILNALHAFKNKKNFSKSLGVEILLYASAQKQIRNAIEIIGVKPGQPIVLVAINSNKSKLEDFFFQASKFFITKIEDLNINELNDEKIQKIREAFKISEEEVKAIKVKGIPLQEILKKLIIERIALLSTKS